MNYSAPSPSVIAIGLQSRNRWYFFKSYFVSLPHPDALFSVNRPRRIRDNAHVLSFRSLLSKTHVRFFRFSLPTVLQLHEKCNVVVVVAGVFLNNNTPFSLRKPTHTRIRTGRFPARTSAAKTLKASPLHPADLFSLGPATHPRSNTGRFCNPDLAICRCAYIFQMS